jgi:SAM-dependent methyltransferase
MVDAWPRPEPATSRASYAAGRRGADPEAVAASRSAAGLLAQYDREHSPYVRYAQRQRLERLARLRPIHRMLDFGCGSGHLLGLAREVFGCETYGIELHPAGELGARRFGFTLHAGPLETAPFPPASFDLVYSAQVLEHLPEPRTEVARLAALLAPGGLLFVEVPNYGSLAIRLGRDRFTFNRPPGHLNFFGRSSLLRLLRGAGLEVVSLRTTGLPYRALLGLPEGTASGATQAVAREASRSPDGLEARSATIGLGLRAKLGMLRVVDTVVVVSRWGIQLEALARRPPDPEARTASRSAGSLDPCSGA